MESNIKDKLIKEEEIKKLENLQKKQNRKTPAKAAGLKSIMIAKDKVILAAYGKGNDTIIEKIVKSNKVESIADPKHFDAKILHNKTKKAEKKEVQVDGRLVQNAKADMPKGVRKDQLGAKDILEMSFFGNEYPEDNIRIQMIYNLLDIEKEYTRHITNVVYAVNHLNRNVHSEAGHASQNDYIGMLFANDTIEKIKETDVTQKANNDIPKNGTKYDRFLSYYKGEENEKTGKREGGAKDYLIYFPEAFESAIKELQSKGRDISREHAEKEVYERLCLLSLLRQSAVHGENLFKDSIVLAPDTVLSDTRYNRLKIVLQNHYNKRVKGIDDSFIENNKKKNLPILFEICKAANEDEKKQLTIDFYNFIVLKENKNMGFSLKKLREILLQEPSYCFMKDQEYDSSRHKLYSIVDFIIYRYYKDKLSNNDDCNEPGIVERLRGTESEEKKDEIYEEEAKILAHDMQSILTPNQMDKLKGDEIQNIKSDAGIKENWLDEVRISDNEPSDFTLVANYLTMFLDGKEINEFLSTLINKLESIAALYSVITNKTINPQEPQNQPVDNQNKKIKGFDALAAIQKELSGKLEIDIEGKFKWIENAEQIAQEIRLLKNVARMNFAQDLDFKRPIYRDAVQVLSTGKNDEELERFINEDMLSLNVKEKSLRNFISNNVIKSRRFQYLMRYSNPTVVQSLMRDENLISFVLKRIRSNNPEQLERYMNSIKETGKDHVETLTRKLLALRLEDILDVKQKVTKGSGEAIKKEKYKALLGLYLTVAYIAIKNLVNINSRYVMAFSAWMRDNALFGIISEKDIMDDRYTNLLSIKMEEGSINKRYSQIFMNNRENFIPDAFLTYRNKVTHLSVILDVPKYLGPGEGKKREITSYFELYHFVIQSIIDKEGKSEGKLAEMLKEGRKHHNYSKDALNVLNTPFGYSLSRYKALTIEALFDKNYPEERLKELEEDKKC